MFLTRNSLPAAMPSETLTSRHTHIHTLELTRLPGLTSHQDEAAVVVHPLFKGEGKKKKARKQAHSRDRIHDIKVRRVSTKPAVRFIYELTERRKRKVSGVRHALYQ